MKKRANFFFTSSISSRTSLSAALPVNPGTEDCSLLEKGCVFPHSEAGQKGLPAHLQHLTTDLSLCRSTRVQGLQSAVAFAAGAVHRAHTEQPLSPTAPRCKAPADFYMPYRKGAQTTVNPFPQWIIIKCVQQNITKENYFLGKFLMFSRSAASTSVLTFPVDEFFSALAIMFAYPHRMLWYLQRQTSRTQSWMGGCKKIKIGWDRLPKTGQEIKTHQWKHIYKDLTLWTHSSGNIFHCIFKEMTHVLEPNWIFHYYPSLIPHEEVI